MKHSDTKRSSSMGGWVYAAAAGLVVAILSRAAYNFGYFALGLIGVVVFLLVWYFLNWLTGTAAQADPEPAIAPQKPTPAAELLASPAVAAPTAAPAAQPSAASAAGPSAMFTSAKVATAEPAKPAPAAKPKAAKAPAKPAAKIAVAPAAKPAAKLAAAKAPKVAKPDGPVRLSAPRKGKADDLKEIEGIGPALEKLCNGLGFYHFDQIANWSEADVAWVNANMKSFKGRVLRDKWIAQCKIIVTDGLEAFRVRAKTNDY